MIPILFSRDETAFTSNGLGRLTNCLSCNVTEELNGNYQCVLRMPKDDVLARTILNYGTRAIVFTTPGIGREPQPFDITRVSMGEDKTVTINAEHISSRLKKIIVKPYTLSSQPPLSIVNAARRVLSDVYNTGQPFTFTLDSTYTAMAVQKTYEYTKPRSAFDFLTGSDNSLMVCVNDSISTWPEISDFRLNWIGEYEWGMFDVKLLKRRGSSTPIIARYGDNVSKHQRYYDYLSGYTGVVPFYVGNDSVIVGDVTRRSDDAPELYANDPDDLLPYDVTSIINERPEVKEGATVTKAMVTDCGADMVAILSPNRDVTYGNEDNITIDLIQAPENIQDFRYAGIGDNAEFYYNGVVYNEARVTRIVYDSILERNNNVTISKYNRPEKTYGDIIRASM